MATRFVDGPDTASGDRERVERSGNRLAKVLPDDAEVEAAIAGVHDPLNRWAALPEGGVLRLGWPLGPPVAA
ncbi:MAG: hypothetical protein ACRDVP_09935 [Acidimicrobiales bacterium]